MSGKSTLSTETILNRDLVLNFLKNKEYNEFIKSNKKKKLKEKKKKKDKSKEKKHK